MSEDKYTSEEIKKIREKIIDYYGSASPFFGTKNAQEDDFVSLSGLSIVVTGELYAFPSRDAFKKYVEEHGGKLVGSVSSKTSYLVTNTPDSGTTKNRTAKSLGIPIVTEEQFLSMVEG